MRLDTKTMLGIFPAIHAKNFMVECKGGFIKPFDTNRSFTFCGMSEPEPGFESILYWHWAHGGLINWAAEAASEILEMKAEGKPFLVTFRHGRGSDGITVEDVMVWMEKNIQGSGTYTDKLCILIRNKKC